ncbi:MAG: DinB family protein [Planctomycetota bacterium]|nr:DinB family protein [Planctomycetota bacterium]
MDVLSYFRAEVEVIGRNSRELLARFDAETALRRPAPNVNHALWLAGHLAWAEDYLVVEVPRGTSVRRKDWDSLFDFTSEKLEAAQYPPFKEVKDEFERVHAEVLRVLNEMSAVDLGKPAVIERRWLPTAAHAISHQVTHGHYHLGQLALLARLLEAGKL